MALKIVMAVVSLLTSTKQMQYLDEAADYYRSYNEACSLNWTRSKEILLYKPTVNTITNIVNSPPIAEDFYEK